MSEREIVTTRLIDAPRERIFEAFSDPDHLTRWGGPQGFTSTFREFDLRPGGVWRFVLHSPDGASALTCRMLFPSAADCDKVKRVAVDANEQNLDRLEAELSRMAPSSAGPDSAVG